MFDDVMMIEVRSMRLIAEMLFLIASFMSVIFSVRLPIAFDRF